MAKSKPQCVETRKDIPMTSALKKQLDEIRAIARLLNAAIALDPILW
jgi:hypothetical protein